ncbi:MAG: hypothetical protein ABFD07_21055, partial [Methanobacterium sp.]
MDSTALLRSMTDTEIKDKNMIASTFGSCHLLDKGRNKGGNLSNNTLSSADVWIDVLKGGNLLNISKQAIRKNCRLGKYVTR